MDFPTDDESAAQSAARRRADDADDVSEDTDDRGDGTEPLDPNDSAPDAYNKVLTYMTMKDQASLGNAKHRANTLRVRIYVLRATCPCHPPGDRACRLVSDVSRRVCTHAS